MLLNVIIFLLSAAQFAQFLACYTRATVVLAPMASRTDRVFSSNL
jgi:hypothetical protein